MFADAPVVADRATQCVVESVVPTRSAAQSELPPPPLLLRAPTAAGVLTASGEDVVVSDADVGAGVLNRVRPMRCCKQSCPPK
ncbi:hypothetical protein AHF37_00376 [Paragonimus kellicotti]|nr:hypothetical protein AHF37_00376 [Paragonimus kellicotti]